MLIWIFVLVLVRANHSQSLSKPSSYTLCMLTETTAEETNIKFAQELLMQTTNTKLQQNPLSRSTVN
jgi:hypothetical protein